MRLLHTVHPQRTFPAGPRVCVTAQPNAQVTNPVSLRALCRGGHTRGPGGTRWGISAGLPQYSSESSGVFGKMDEQESLDSP